MMLSALATLVPCVALGAAGQLCLKAGLDAVKLNLGIQEVGLALIAKSPMSVFSNPFVIFGFLAYGLSSILWLTLVSKYPLSLIYPMVSLGYLFVVIGAALIFKEKPNVYAIMALMLIVAGVSLMAKAGKAV